MSGLATSIGAAEGEVLLVTDPGSVSVPKLNKGQILVCGATDPGWVHIMSQVGGLVTERGSLLSHTAIIGREMGLPTIVGVKDAMKCLKTGDRIRIDTQNNQVVLLSE